MSTSISDHLCEGDEVIFTSIHGNFPINAKKARIIEIVVLTEERLWVETKGKQFNEMTFPGNISYCIKFGEDFYTTWCRRDEIVKV